MAVNIYKTKIQPRLCMIAKYKQGGLNNLEICTLLGISESSFYEYQNKYPEFADVTRRDKEEACAEVEYKYFKNCVGYEYTEEQVTSKKEIFYDDDGKKIKEITKPVKIKAKRYRHPDASAAKWYLTNRDPERWKDTAKVELSGDKERPIKIDLSNLSTNELKELIESEKADENNKSD